ncbi:hypothetical protein V3468_00490 [Flavobacterium oreochromis]|uniref:hypothetical protein n=1 Tax=Flavobacterium oreochromis TaxID=2906078 RepID=UPI00385D7F23
MEIAKLVVESEQYQNLIDKVKQRTKLKILSEYRDLAAGRDEQKMNIANLSKEVALQLLEFDKENFMQFVLLKMQKFENVKIDEEFPENENIEIEDDNEIILGYSKSFLLIYLIEYFLLKTTPLKLEIYLKETRVPNAKKYEKELKEIYNKL